MRRPVRTLHGLRLAFRGGIGLDRARSRRVHGTGIHSQDLRFQMGSIRWRVHLSRCLILNVFVMLIFRSLSLILTTARLSEPHKVALDPACPVVRSDQRPRCLQRSCKSKDIERTQCEPPFARVSRLCIKDFTGLFVVIHLA